MPNRLPYLLACGALLMATAAHAQAQARPAAPRAGSVKIIPAAPLLAPQRDVPTDVSPLTVQGPPAPEAVQKEARDFVQLVTAPSPAIDQLPRWYKPICISVAGLSPDQQARVSARITEVAAGVGLRTLPPGCKANVEVVFTDQPQVFMDKVAKTKEQNLGYYHRHERDKLKTVTRPIQAWYMTATDSGATDTASMVFATLVSTGASSSNAAPVTGAPVGVTAFNAIQRHPDAADDPDETVPTGCADAPAFTHCLTSELTNALIVVDPSRLKDKTLGPVTDYLSMLALAQIKSLDGCAALPSVIDLLGKPCVGRQSPDGLSPADAAYLTGLYAADLQANKSLEVNDIAGRMGGMLARGGR